MPRCRRCGEKFEYEDSSDYSPARELGDIFLDSVGEVEPRELCAECREELGTLSLLGFDE